MPAIEKEPLFVSDPLRVVRLRVEAGGTVPEHHSNVDVVVTVVRGNGRFDVEGSARDIAPGDVVVMKPKQRHSSCRRAQLSSSTRARRGTPRGA